MPYFLIALFIYLTSFSPLHAASSATINEDIVQSRLITGTYEAKDGTTVLHTGLHMKFQPEWKTYWRSGGDGGFPVELTYEGSSNISDHTLFWPGPHRKVAFGSIETYGYLNEVVLPIDVVIQDASQPAHIAMKARYAVCNELCVYFDHHFTVDVAPNANDAEAQQLIDRYHAQVPMANGENGLRITQTLLTSPTSLTVTADSTTPFSDAVDMFIDGNVDFRFPQPTITFNTDRTQATFTYIIEPLLKSKALKDFPVNFVLVNGEQSVEWPNVSIPTAPDYAAPADATAASAVSPNTPAAPITLSSLLVLAFIGGLILNIMPCVLPVLSLKMLSVLKYGGAAQGKIRTSFMLSALGIISSFLLLAGVVIALQQAGMAAGWGFQFQHPGFLLFLILVLTLFAANQFGWFEVMLNQHVNQRVNKKLDDHHHSTPLSHFLTGAFATLLATPCSAPFLGTAVGFALSQSALHILIVFGTMGIGLATPYILITAFPQMVSLLPKPGSWMLTVKKILAGFLLVTALWLLTVLHEQTGLRISIAIGMLMLLMLMVIKLRTAVKPLVAAIILAAIAAINFIPVTTPESSEPQASSLPWQPFEEARIASLVGEGNVVLVDVTAEWCITCKFNKANVLTRGTVKERLLQPHTVLMKADYTSPSDTIRDYLKKHGRYGIPFNIIYGPHAPDGIRLPELLSDDAVVGAIKQAE